MNVVQPYRGQWVRMAVTKPLMNTIVPSAALVDDIIRMTVNVAVGDDVICR